MDFAFTSRRRSLIALACALMANSVSGKMVLKSSRSSLEAGLKFFSNNDGSPGSGYTIANQMPALGVFTHVRLVYANPTTADVTLDTAKIASPATSGDSGSTLTWQPVTFGSGTSVNLPARVGTAPEEILTYVKSDWIALTPGSALNLIHTRSYFSGGAAAIDMAFGDLAAFNTVSGLQPCLAANVSGVVADNVGITLGASGGSRAISPHGLVIRYTLPVVWGATIGGSHLRGNGTTGDSWGFATRAALQRNSTDSTRIWSPWNAARAGSGSAPCADVLSGLVSQVGSPDYCLILAYSGNDGAPTAPRIATAKTNVNNQLAVADAAGATTFICAQPPQNSWSATEDGFRNEQNDWAAALGRTFVDLNAFYEDPANLGNGLPAYQAGDGIHYNDTGQALPAADLAPRLPGS